MGGGGESPPLLPRLGQRRASLSCKHLGTKGLHLEAGSHVKSRRGVVLEPEQLGEGKSRGQA